MFRKYQLKFSRNRQSRIDETIVGVWVVKGKEKNHQQFINEILTDQNIKEFDF